MADQLSFDKALSLARSMTTITEFPRFEDAVTATALDLVDWCQGVILDGRAWSAETQARWLVTEARRKWTKWAGTAGFFELFQSKFAPKKRLEQQVLDLGQKPPVACRNCNDFGTRFNGKIHQYCECEAGKATETDLGESWLRLLNKTKQQPTKPLHLVTEADVEVWQRCHHCSGTGLNASGYCSCSTGRDLAVVERRERGLGQQGAGGGGQ